jgi:predicted flap endonuclease-1-like 5' DNA nuclease
MRVLMTRLAAGPDGVLLAGREYEVGAALGAGLVASGAANELGYPGPPHAGAGNDQAEAMPDRLTAIRGIGARTAEALNAAGVWTFQQLADADPDALAEALDGSSPGQVRRWQAESIGFLG